jgi:hypothetical protein
LSIEAPAKVLRSKQEQAAMLSEHESDLDKLKAKMRQLFGESVFDEPQHAVPA